MKKHFSGSPHLFLYKRCKKLQLPPPSPSFTGRGGLTRHLETPSLQQLGALTHRHTDSHLQTHTVGFHWGLPMNLCNLYRKQTNKQQTHGGTLRLNTWERTPLTVTQEASRRDKKKKKRGLTALDVHHTHWMLCE